MWRKGGEHRDARRTGGDIDGSLREIVTTTTKGRGQKAYQSKHGKKQDRSKRTEARPDQIKP